MFRAASVCFDDEKGILWDWEVLCFIYAVSDGMMDVFTSQISWFFQSFVRPLGFFLPAYGIAGNWAGYDTVTYTHRHFWYSILSFFHDEFSLPFNLTQQATSHHRCRISIKPTITTAH